MAGAPAPAAPAAAWATEAAPANGPPALAALVNCLVASPRGPCFAVLGDGPTVDVVALDPRQPHSTPVITLAVTTCNVR